MRAVVDTNILISALISPGGLPDLLYQLWQAKKFNLVISEFQIEELREVTRYPHLTERFKPYNAGRLINSLRDNALVIG
jgi:putative PIN family toxin of toxin-antitoxin system